MPNEELEHEENNKNGTRNENQTTSSDENCIENIDGRLKCDECEQERNLWLCLRDTCMFVGCGCGKDEKSNKHSTLHARVRKKFSFINQFFFSSLILEPKFF